MVSEVGELRTPPRAYAIGIGFGALCVSTQSLPTKVYSSGSWTLIYKSDVGCSCKRIREQCRALKHMESRHMHFRRFNEARAFPSGKSTPSYNMWWAKVMKSGLY